MSVMHDYKCDLHGFFEAWEPVCPDGCTENVQMVFLQPVGTKSDTTKHNDKTLDQLALDFNMTNIKSAKEGDSQVRKNGQRIKLVFPLFFSVFFQLLVSL